MCNCMEEIDKKLLEAGHNTRLGWTMNAETGVAYVGIRTEKVDPKNRKQPIAAIPTFCPWCAERYAPAPNRGWSKTPPTVQDWYWNWSGNEDDAPLPVSVLFSGSTNKCFVSCGQLGLTHAIDCDEYGGWWHPMIAPALPPPE